MINPEDTFQSTFNQAATARVQSPGRINLIGEHIDYLGGCVLPIAIEKLVTMVAAQTNKGEIQIHSPVIRSEPVSISLEDLVPRSAPDEIWLNYVLGVLAGYREAGFAIPGFNASISSELPSGAGLSSSAAVEMVTALAIEALSDRSLTAQKRALICQQAEHQFAGVPCGIMDQMAVSEGKADHGLMIDCHDLSLKQIKIPAGIVIVVADTKEKHALADGEYRKRREDCENAIEILGIESLREADMPLIEAC